MSSFSRLEYLDLAKAFAILLVVMGHVLQHICYGMGSHYVWNGGLNHFFYYFHMPLFIFLSGLVSVTSIRKKDIFCDLYKRFRTLVVPAIVMMTLLALCYGYNLRVAIFDNMKIGYWYLFTLFGLYVLIYTFSFFSKRKCIAVYLLSVPICIFLHRHLYVLGNISGLFCLDNLLYYYPIFIFANAVKRFSMHDILFNGYVLVITSLLWILSEVVGGGKVPANQLSRRRTSLCIVVTSGSQSACTICS